MAEDAPGGFRSVKILAMARIAIFGVVAVVAVSFVWSYDSIVVPADNDQMAPRFQPGTRIMVHRGYTAAGEFKRGDVAVYAVAAEKGVCMRLGRVVGLPGDRVEVRPDAAGGEVVVNGERAGLTPFLITGDPPRDMGSVLVRAAGALAEGTGAAETSTVPEGAIFVLNDSPQSRLSDSRKLGAIPDRALVGKVVMRLSF